MRRQEISVATPQDTGKRSVEWALPSALVAVGLHRLHKSGRNRVAAKRAKTFLNDICRRRLVACPFERGSPAE